MKWIITMPHYAIDWWVLVRLCRVIVERRCCYKGAWCHLGVLYWQFGWLRLDSGRYMLGLRLSHRLHHTESSWNSRCFLIDFEIWRLALWNICLIRSTNKALRVASGEVSGLDYIWRSVKAILRLCRTCCNRRSNGCCYHLLVGCL